MQSSDVPAWTPKKFAGDASGTYIRAVPQTTADPAAASFSLGFPPQTFTDEGAGGTPPDGRDFNGILNFLSAWAQWVGLGGPVAYNAAVSTAGGYPRGARVLSASYPGRVFVCVADNNTTNPDAGGANWVVEEAGYYQDFTGAGSGNLTVPAWATHAEVELIGAGGGGGGAGANSSGGGGGAGGFAFGIINVTPGATMAYSVGAGGAGGASGLNGQDGAATTFAGITATGGGGGSLAARSSGGFGGGSSGGPRNFTGSDGGDGNASNVLVQGGNGAAGPYGGAGRTGNPGGGAGHSAGSGAGGGWGVASAPGGRGADGALLIRWLL